jgi:hypothetical protein
MATKKKETSEAEVPASIDEAVDKGYIGDRVDPLDDDRYSLKTGPESPTAVEQAESLKEQN